jgi:hypothetical protein
MFIGSIKYILATSAVLATAMASTRANSLEDSPAPKPAEAPASPQAAKPLVAPDPPRLQVEVADSKGQKLPGVDLIVATGYSGPLGGPTRGITRGVTDQDGRAIVPLAIAPDDQVPPAAMIWAYKPGCALSFVRVALRGVISKTQSPPPTRLVMKKANGRNITVLDADGHPVVGLQLVPCMIRAVGGVGLNSIPDEWSARFTVTTDASGKATFPNLSPVSEPLTVRVSSPSIASHTLSLPNPPGNDTLQIGRPGRLVGIVRSESGQPLGGVSVDLWVRASGDVPLKAVERNSTPTERIPLDGHPLVSGPQGAFQTPATLLGGSTYRVSIHHDGFAPFVSEWQTLEGSRVVIPPIRLRSLKTLAGKIHDRQGRAVPAARVFLPSGGPTTRTDVNGRFTLASVLPDKTVLLVECPGFRLHGLPIDPSTQTGELSLTLARTQEAPEQSMAVLDEPIPLDEARTLANRVIEPYLRDALEKGSDGQKRQVITALGNVDPDRALDLVKQADLDGHPFSPTIRASLSLGIAPNDPAGAEALIQSITSPDLRSAALVRMIRFLPASEGPRKRRLLEQVTPLVRSLADPLAKIVRLGTVAGIWLDLHEVERARSILHEALPLYDALPEERRRNAFPFALARLEPDAAMERIEKIPELPRVAFAAVVAPEVAIDQPALAERLFDLMLSGDRVPNNKVLLLCRRLASVDPPRARHVAMSLKNSGTRACAWACVAFGLMPKDRPAALEALDKAIDEIDHFREKAHGLETAIPYGSPRNIDLANPAVLILPIVEQVAPERLAEVFWRAIALHPKWDPDNERLLVESAYLGTECMILARYDRNVAAALFAPMDAYLKSLSITKPANCEFDPSALIAKSCIDPRAAVELLEALPPPRVFGSSSPVHESRLYLAEDLAQPAEKRWRSRWIQTALVIPHDD